MRQLSVLNNCSLGIKGTMTNIPTPLRTFLEVRPGVVIYTDVAAMDMPSISRARNIVTFIHRTSALMKDFHTKSESEAMELLKRQVFCVER